MEEMMLQRIVLTTMFAAFAAGVGHAQSNASTPTTLQQTAATNGKQMYVSYCASCHGVDGRATAPLLRR
jgi:mono/diheme cytochrome c family protein